MIGFKCTVCVIMTMLVLISLLIGSRENDQKDDSYSDNYYGSSFLYYAMLTVDILLSVSFVCAAFALAILVKKLTGKR